MNVRPKLTENAAFVEWMQREYPDRSNEDLAREWGVCKDTIARYGRAMGLKKSERYWQEFYRQRGYALKFINRKNGFNPACNLRRCVIAPKQLLGEERWKEAIEKAKKTRRETIAAEKRRVMFGLPQKTQLRIFRKSRGKYVYEHRLRKSGYVMTSQNVYVRPEKPHPMMERTGKKYDIRFIDA